MNNVVESDLSTGYFYKNEDIGFNRSEILSKKLNDFYYQKFNSYISINSCDSYKQNQNITIIINQDIDYILEISEYCHTINSKLIVLFSGGISGVIMTDNGENIINDSKYIEPIQIESISSDGIVLCFQNINHNLQDNDIIKLDDLEGVNIEQLNKEWKVKIINKSKFQLIDFNNIEKITFINGRAYYIQQSKIIKHQLFNDNINNIQVNSYNDLSKQLIQMYLQLYKNNLINNMPFIWSDENELFLNNNNIILKDYARIVNIEIAPIVSIMGALVSFEVIKLIINKYISTNQWLVWYDNNLLPIIKPYYYNINNNYSILYGDELEYRLNKSNIVINGLGSIANEHIKNLSLLNIKNINIIDSNLIEKSNISTDLFFNINDIGKNKLTTIKENIKSYNNNIDLSLIKNISLIENITCMFDSVDSFDSRKILMKYVLKIIFLF